MQEDKHTENGNEELRIHIPDSAPSEENTVTEKEVEDLRNSIAALEQEVSDWKDKFIRKVAEFDNFKRRSEQEQQMLFKYAGEFLAVKILPVIDDFERSLQHGSETADAAKIMQGVQMIYEKFMRILNEQGITKIESVGKPFDVEHHDALMQQPSAEVPDQTVLQEVEAGYIYKDKVIRHAKVIVSSAVEAEENGAAEKEQDNG